MNSNEKFLLALIVTMGSITAFIVLPVLKYVLLAIVLAYVLYPLHTHLREYVGGSISAITLITCAMISIILPLVYIFYVFTRDLRAIQQGESGLDIPTIESRIYEETGREVNIEASLSSAGEQLVDIFFGGITGVLTTVLELSVGLALVLFLLFYLLRDGEQFVDWVEELSPLPKSDTQQLFEKVNQTMWGSIIAHSCASVVQAVLAGTLMWILGIPNVIFWTVVMAILSFLPLIGAFLVWAPASAYLVVVGQTTSGVILLVYGLTVVNLIEHYIRPLLIDQSAHINPAVILVGIIGGIYTFGFVGLFVGPIVIGVLAATLETMNEKQAAKEAAVTPQTGMATEPASAGESTGPQDTDATPPDTDTSPQDTDTTPQD